MDLRRTVRRQGRGEGGAQGGATEMSDDDNNYEMENLRFESEKLGARRYTLRQPLGSKDVALLDEVHA